MIKTYQAKPKKKKAMKYTGTQHSIREAKDWLGKFLLKVETNKHEGQIIGLPRTYLIIGTLEGPNKCSPGDYIIRGIKGEFYPCKPDVFEESYSEVIDD